MTDDLTAARERHVKGAMPALCHHDPLNYPCDAASFRDALDASKAAWEHATDLLMFMTHERDAARALADELGENLDWALRELAYWVNAWMDTNSVQVFNGYNPWQHKPSLALGEPEARAALAKWEASHE